MVLRLIQVGLGGWGKNWLRDIVTPHRSVESVAWVEIDPATLQSAQEQFDLPAERCFTNVEQALEQVEADAILVTASLGGHVPATRSALLAGKHVLLEKPFAPSLAEAAELVELAERQQRILMISQNYRFYPAVQKVRELVRDQALGPVSSISIDFRRYANASPVVNRHYQIWHPLLADMAIHHFDLLRAVLGQEPQWVMCQTWNPTWSKFVEPPAASMMVAFDGGTIINYRGSWISQFPQTNWAGEWKMDCERGGIAWTSRGELPDEVLMHKTGEQAQVLSLPALTFRDRSGSLEAFVQACQSNTLPETTGRDNLKTLAFMLAAIESAETGQPVHIPDPL